MRPGGHRPDTGPAAAVRDAERLVQVEVADVGPELPRPGQPDQRVQVRPVDVHLAAGVVDEAADLGHGRLEDAVRARVGDHQRGQLRPVLLDLGLEVLDVDVPARGGADHDNLHTGHHGAGRVGPVGAGRDEADVAVGVAGGEVEGADRQEPRKLALRAGVGLQAHRVVPGDLAEPALEVGDELAVPAGVLDRREGVQ